MLSNSKVDRRILNMSIIVNLRLSHCFVVQGKIQQAEDSVVAAEKLCIKLKSLAEAQEEDYKLKENAFNDIFSTIPACVIQSYILLQKSYIELTKLNFLSCGELLTIIWEKGEYYDQSVRNKALQMLEHLFELFSLDGRCFQALAEQNTTKKYEIIVLIDCSRTMENS